MEENKGFQGNEEAFSELVNNNHEEAVNTANDTEVTQMTNKHHNDVKINYSGKPYNGVKQDAKKITRREALKLGAAIAIGTVTAAAVGKIAIKVTNEHDFASSVNKTNDLIGEIIVGNPFYENDENFDFGYDENDNFYINSCDKAGYDKLIETITTYSKYQEGKQAGKGLSIDQAIYAIGLCGSKDVYKTYYGKSKDKLIEENFQGEPYVANIAYMNYMQEGLSINGENIKNGIPYDEGINNLALRVRNNDLQEESGKAL